MSHHPLLECFLFGNSVPSQLLSCESANSSHNPQPRLKGVTLLGCLICYQVLPFWQTGLSQPSTHPPTVAAALLAPPNWRLPYNLIFTPFCRGILKQTLHSLPPKLLPSLKHIESHSSWTRHPTAWSQYMCDSDHRSGLWSDESLGMRSFSPN